MSNCSSLPTISLKAKFRTLLVAWCSTSGCQVSADWSSKRNWQRRGLNFPIIFLTGHADIPMTVQAMKAGAVEFLTKPCRDQDLLHAVRTALERDRVRRKNQMHTALLRAQSDRLTTREKEVMGFVAAGLLNKQIAAEMDITEVTVKMHRGNIMRKMQARSLADLVRMADLLGISRTKSKAP
jgi:FixJ family two-component response regulator